MSASRYITALESPRERILADVAAITASSLCCVRASGFNCRHRPIPMAKVSLSRPAHPELAGWDCGYLLSHEGTADELKR